MTLKNVIHASRSDARQAGAATYFTGKPCPTGHVADRRVQNGGCVECLRARHKGWLLSNKDKAFLATSNWRSTNRDQILQKRREFRQSEAGALLIKEQRRAAYVRDPQKHRQRAIAEYHANPAKASERHRAWRLSNPAKDAQRNARRRDSMLQATPPWVDFEAIGSIYASRPTGFHVDHIIPLKGVLPDGSQVSGLHVPWNLRHLPASKNTGRRNRVSQEDLIAIGVTA
jgi:hypothetical protein